jgi:hypothetical protein
MSGGVGDAETVFGGAHRVLLAFAMVGAMLLGVMAVGVPQAHAFAHNWACNAASAVQCYDYEGQQYVDWAQVTASMDYVSSDVCAKSITAAGNVRANSCMHAVNYDITCYTSSTPDSWAYVYWAGAGSPSIRNINGRASQAFCD